MPFGAVMFGNPNTKGETTLPEAIACGYLDGRVLDLLDQTSRWIH
jgi:hypothetical protein